MTLRVPLTVMLADDPIDLPLLVSCNTDSPVVTASASSPPSPAQRSLPTTAEHAQAASTTEAARRRPRQRVACSARRFLLSSCRSLTSGKMDLIALHAPKRSRRAREDRRLNVYRARDNLRSKRCLTALGHKSRSSGVAAPTQNQKSRTGRDRPQLPNPITPDRCARPRSRPSHPDPHQRPRLPTTQDRRALRQTHGDRATPRRADPRLPTRTLSSAQPLRSMSTSTRPSPFGPPPMTTPANASPATMKQRPTRSGDAAQHQRPHHDHPGSPAASRAAPTAQ